MSEKLSQEEIDMLLMNSASSNDSFGDESTAEDKVLNEIEQDALGEIGNIQFGGAATALSALLGHKVEITVPSVEIIRRNELDKEHPVPYVFVYVTYTDGFSGDNILMLKKGDAAAIADLMMGGDGISPDENLDEIQLSALQEAMNQMIGNSSTSMSTLFNKRVDISPPSIEVVENSISETSELFSEHSLFVKVSFKLKVGDIIDSVIMQVLPVDFAKELVAELMAPEEKSEEEESKTEIFQPAIERDNKISKAVEETLASSSSGQADNFTTSEPKLVPEVQRASFSEFPQEEEPHHESKNLGVLLDIPLNVTVELGRTSRSVRDILELGAGSIIELDKLAGEPVDILINSRLIAKGEVVVIDENFGVRVTNILSQSDRLQQLK